MNKSWFYSDQSSSLQGSITISSVSIDEDAVALLFSDESMPDDRIVNTTTNSIPRNCAYLIHGVEQQ